MDARRLAVALAVALGVATTAGQAAAHPLAPSLLELHEQDGGRVQVLWKTPRLKPSGTTLEPLLPAPCRPTSRPSATRDGTGLVARWQVECGPDGLFGRELHVRGLRETGTSTLLRLVRPDGTLVQALLTDREPFVRVPEHSSERKVARDYLLLGMHHLLFGFDHVLFLLGLLLLIPDRRCLLLTITSFTVGHSVTLALATLGFVNLPSAPVEAAIAASILLLAAEIARGEENQPSALRRRPWAIALPFGLLHGLGFAGALAETGLPAQEIPLALLAFNLGIEAGQLLLAAAAWTSWRAYRALGPVRLPRFARFAPAYGIGSLAGFWVLQRTAAWLGWLS